MRTRRAPRRPGRTGGQPRRRRPADAGPALHGQRLPGGRRGGRAGRGHRLVHGAAPAELRGAHAGGRVVSRGSCRPLARGQRDRRLLRRQHRRGPGDRPRAAVAGRARREPGVRRHRYGAGLRPGHRRTVRQSLRRVPRQRDGAAVRLVPRRVRQPGHRPGGGGGLRPRRHGAARPPALLRHRRPGRRRRPRCSRPGAVGGIPAGARLHGGRGEPDHRCAAGVRPPGHAGRRRPAADRAARCSACAWRWRSGWRWCGWPWAWPSTRPGRSASSCPPSGSPPTSRPAPCAWSGPGPVGRAVPGAGRTVVAAPGMAGA